MSQYIIKSGNLYADGMRNWVADQNQAFVYCDYPETENEKSRADYRPNAGFEAAKAHADTFRIIASEEEVQLARLFGATDQDVFLMTEGNKGHEDARVVRIGSFVEVEL